jgi:hypothetical protein
MFEFLPTFFCTMQITAFCSEIHSLEHILPGWSQPYHLKLQRQRCKNLRRNEYLCRLARFEDKYYFPCSKTHWSTTTVTPIKVENTSQRTTM